MMVLKVLYLLLVLFVYVPVNKATITVNGRNMLNVNRHNFEN